MARGLIDRFFVALALLVLRGFFRSVEVAGRDRIPSHRPLLVVANHFNGFVDPVILVYVLGRVPRFLAKAALWRAWMARPFLALAGVLPINRPQDVRQRVQDNVYRAENEATFTAVHEMLRKRGTVAIFPEGVTHDEPRLARIRTGAARIALGARAVGAEGLMILPIGLVVDDKLALRTRGLARVGEPIDVDALVDSGALGDVGAPEPSRSAVQQLTADIEDRLRAVSPDYADRREAQLLSRAAEIWLRRARHSPESLTERESVAQRLAHAPRHLKATLLDSLARYLLHLDLAGLRDHQVTAGLSPRELLVGFARIVVLVAVLAPLWVPGVLINFVPWSATSMAGRTIRNPVMKGTMRLLTALAVFPLTWAVVLVATDVQGWGANVALLVAMPVTGLVAVAVLERIVRAWRAWRGWLGLIERRALLDDLRADRDRVVECVDDALGRAPSDPLASVS